LIMEKAVKISVVIPAYQVEQYLRECVDSVLKQTYPHVEVILVDDGSTDTTASICDMYARADKRVTVIHQENGGLSDARNTGIRNASGDYVLFLDGDDFYAHSDALSMLAGRAQVTCADVIQFSYEKYDEESGNREPYLKTNESMQTGLTPAQQLEYLFDHGLYIASACNKMIRRSLLDEHLRFEKGIYSEDIDWCARLLVRAQSFDYLAEQLYSYRQRSSSIRHTINDKKCRDLAENILKCFALAGQACDEKKRALLNYTAFQYGTFFMVQAQAEHVPYDCIEKLRPFKWILKHHGRNKKLLLLHLSCCMIGYRATCCLIRKAFAKK